MNDGMERSLRDWFTHGWRVAIFEKPNGERIAAPLSYRELEKLKVGEIGAEQGWRCKLVAKPETVEEAIDALHGVELAS